MHLRVKRKNQTMFIWAEPTESVESLKGKIEAIVKVSITEMRLYADLLATSHVMADKETLDKLGVQPEQELALVFKLPGSDDYEAIDITSDAGQLLDDGKAAD
eukprot:CAMPEP_0179913456 /NCGR_PEP_ID=MMETSP0983-20121128/493_1 /TAXON_ID=483367 /ORGANISM="non described non described, Strain CCMP 2436" /LENGTH=102 /DNA_ID=CAMNT_0021815493 /DNA_START=645 /DNA_END=953 /DNA_ORIENTATION=-